MLWMVLIVPLVLLLLSLLAIWHSKWWTEVMLVLGTAFILLPSLTLGGPQPFPAALVLFVVLLVIVGILRFLPRYRKRLGVVLPIAATVGVYAYYGWNTGSYWRELNTMLARYPFESVEERLPLPGPSLRPASLSEETSADLNRLEGRLWFSPRGRRSDHRSQYLYMLHEMTVDSFINHQGFGVGRMRFPTERLISAELREERSVPQPQTRPYPVESQNAIEPKVAGVVPPGVQTLHEASIIDFSYLSGIGYVKDRGHVAGFLPHGFSEVPAGGEKWAVENVDLLSLLLHAEPVAYVSANLPRMDELQQAPTRPLDAFESAGLKRLCGGEGLIVGEQEDHVRLLGAIRATMQCQECHGAERGDLLGAFSYTLRRKGS
jgi:hypothetical protein